MNRISRWTAILAAMVLPTVSSCGDAPLAPQGAVPGALIVSLEGDGPPAGAVLFRVTGEQVTDVVAINPAHSVFTQHSEEDGGSWLVAVIGGGTHVTGSLFSFTVPDVTRSDAYAVSLVEAADEANNVRPDISGYRIDVLRKH
jgi:hypothetical protein